MKAAVLEKFGEAPKYKDFPAPEAKNDNQILLNIKAAAVKNLDKLRASGKHYASHKQLPDVVGMDGVGTLEDGKRVYAQGLTGMIAEKAVINKNRYSPIPDSLDYATAAALPNAVLGAVMPIKVRGKIQKGQHVLINGGTGVTGNLAIQIAKHYGADTIIVVGRGEKELEKAKTLGAKITIDTEQDEESFIEALKNVQKDVKIDLIIDYLWGEAMEKILKSIEGGGLESSTHKIRIVSVGSLAGKSIQLESETLRSSDIEILGSGFGSLSEEDIDNYSQKIIPEMFELAANGTLKIETQVESIEDIENLWNKDIASGKRLVISLE